MKDPRLVVVGIGESLFDCFPDRVVLGGAPMNFVIHASALLRSGGGVAYPLTRIGEDELGTRFLSEMQQRAVSVDYVQHDASAPTGRVFVSADGRGEPSYRFENRNAWDLLEFGDRERELARVCDAVCFGTLAQRHDRGRSTVRSFLQAAPQAIRLLDLNLREGQYESSTIDESLRLATAVKLNSEELNHVARMVSTAKATENSGDGLESKARRVAETHELEFVAVTLGGEGSGLLADGEWTHVEADKTFARGEGAVDTVGAGDAFSATLLVAWLRDCPPTEALRLANRVGGFVASHRGATPELPTGIDRL